MPYYSHILSRFIFVFLVILTILLPNTLAYEPYAFCSEPISCANITNMNYPFWSSLRPQYCGHPGFQLNCSGDLAVITIMSLNYRVLQINQKARTLTVTRADYSNTLCPTYLANTTLNTTLLDYTWDTQELWLYYNCKSMIDNGFNCNSDQQEGFNNVNVIGDNYNYSAIQTCNESVVLRVLENQPLYSNKSSTGLIEEISSGFGLKWKANINRLCDDCQGSGGQCGSDSASGSFACHCKDRAYQFICGSDSEPDFVDEQYLECSTSFECGGLENISYPFWGGSRPEYCGHPDFKLEYCGSASFPVMIGSKDYFILGINQTTQALNIIRRNFSWDYHCPSASPENFTKTWSLFNYSTWDTEFLTLFYNCTGSSNISLELRSFCYFPTYLLSDYILTENQNSIISVDGVPLGHINRTCNLSIVIPVSRSASKHLAATPPPNYKSNSSYYSDLLEEVLYAGFWLEWKIPNKGRCNDCQSSGGVCGYDSSSREFTCYCKDRPHQTTCSPNSSIWTPSYPGSSLKRDWAIGISAALSAIIVISVSIFCNYKSKSGSSKLLFWKEDQKEECDVEAILRNYGSFSSKRYTYAEVKKMTNSFAEKIGNGGFGTVYKGKLPDGSLVAVKVLKESKGNGEEFVNEVASISTTSHINIVTLLGFCYERKKRALIYEYMPKGSLDKFIFNQESSNTNSRLEWKTLFEIAAGIARGLEYLHRGCTSRILHFDIKPHNILLDDDFCPKISDFGLAKLCRRDNSIVSMLGARGTAGYAAPEIYCRNFGAVSFKSDVYSYGMMVLEMVGGRKNIDVGVSRTSEIYFPDWLYKHIEDGENFTISEEMTNEDDEIARKMILVSLWCIQTMPSNRPSMTKVVEMLEGSLQSLQIPPKPSLALPQN